MLGGSEDDAPLRYVERYRKVASGAAAAVKRKKPVIAVVQAQGPILLGRAGGTLGTKTDYAAPSQVMTVSSEVQPIGKLKK